MPISFNRYMVECESMIEVALLYQSDGFNRYMVECEFYPRRLSVHLRCVLIDTWWNVNLDISIFEEKCNTF